MRTALLSLLLSSVCFAAGGFELKPVDGNSLGVWEDGKPVLVYNHGMISKEGVPARYNRARYVHPLYGLDGEVITEDFPSDHRHHRGIFWAWPGIKIDGKTYNSWIPSGIHYKTEKWVRKETTTKRATIEVLNGWYTGETKVADERLVLIVYAAHGDSRAIDFDLTWTALDKPIQLWGAKGKSYGGFTVRYNTQFKDKGGIKPEDVFMTVPGGVTEKDLAVKRLEWADLTAKWPGTKTLSGAAVFIHKSHPDYPPTWLTRHYGALCVGWPGVAPGKPLEPGKPVTCRYRVWVHRALIMPKAYQNAYNSYLNTKQGRTAMFDSIWQAITNELSGDRTRDSVARLWEHARWNSFDRIRDTAEEAATLLRETGFRDVQILEFPADGVTAHGGWVMPQAWDVDDAALEIVDPAVGEPRLARYRECPQNLMMWSPPTPPEGVEAEVVLPGEPCEGKIVLVDGVGLEVSREPFAAGAIGIVSDHIRLAGSPQDKGDGHFDHAVQWHNYTIPLWRTERKGFGFSISPTQGHRLRALLAEPGTVRLRAVVRTRLYDGILPCVTGLMPGETDGEVVLTGHLFEPGANDNASGPALGIECIRAIAALCKRGELPTLRRGLRPVFTFEVRGYQAFLAAWAHLGRVVAGLNLDMVGNDLADARAQANLVYNFASAPACTDVLAEELLERLGEEDPAFRLRVHKAGALVDNLFGEPAVGAPMAVLGCWPDAYYHNSLDVLDTISPEAMARFGRMAGTYLAFLATAGLDEAQALADLVVRRSEGVPPEKTAARLRSIQRLVPSRPVVPTREGLSQAGDWLSPETHLFQDEALKAYLDEKIESLMLPTPPPSLPPRGGGVGSRAARTFKGALCLESLDEAALAEFEEKTGVGLSWGVPHWLQLAVFRSNGKRSARDIHRWLAGEVSAPPFDRFCNAVGLLARHGFLRLRPVLDGNDYRAAFEAVGVPRGETVLVHSSLSAFGYVEGGARTVLAALQKAVGPDGTLAMPTLSCSWVGRPPFDVERTPSRVGAVTEAFRTLPGVLRSDHPSHSVAALGPLASEIVATHDPERPVFAPESPWGKLYDLDAWILMLCKLSSNTAMHMGDERNGLLRTDLVAHVVENGVRREVPIVHAPWHVNYDRNYELLRERGQLRSATLGEGEVHLMRFRDAVDAATENVAADPMLVTGGETCTCPFCRNVRAWIANP